MRPVDSVLAALAKRGVLLKQDKALPNVVGILTGEALHTSWWSHPRAHLIFAVLSELEDHPDVLLTKLVSRKDTLVHRPLWPALLAVGTAREPWQTKGLSAGARRLLERLDSEDGPVRASGAPVRQLEERLLGVTREVHTESGRHERQIESWGAWSLRAGCSALKPLPRAREVLEEAAVALGAPLRSLPWRARGAAV